MSKQKGTFNAGWWNCFYSFADEILFRNPNATDILTSVLEGAGITSREAVYQLEHYSAGNEKIEEVLRDYWLNYGHLHKLNNNSKHQ